MAKSLDFPIAIGFSPMARMIAAVEIEEGLYRRFSGIQRPAPTDPTTQTESYEYSEGSEELAGTTTPGNVSLVFTHNPGSLIDDFLKNANKQGDTVNLRFYTRGEVIFTQDDARMTVSPKAASGYAKGLSRVNFFEGTNGADAFTAADGSTLSKVAKLVEDGKIREGLVIEFATPVDANTPPHLGVIEQPIPIFQAGTDKIVDYEIYVKGSLGPASGMIDLKTGANGFTLNKASTIWQVSGALLNYSPQFDLAARTARIEVVRTTESDSLVSLADVHKEFIKPAS